jgi:hypothetical protein
MSKETSSEQTTVSASNKNEKESKPAETAQSTTVEPPSLLDIETISTQPPPIPPLSTQPDSLSSPVKTDKLIAPLVEPEVSTSNVPTPTIPRSVETTTSSSSKIIETKHDLVQSNGSPYKSSIAPRQTVISRRANVNSTVIANQTAHLNSIASNPISMRGPNNVVGQVIK